MKSVNLKRNKIVVTVLLIVVYLFCIKQSVSAEEIVLQPPTQLQASPVNAATIHLEWQDDSSQKGIYAIYRKQEESEYERIGFIPMSDSTSYEYQDQDVVCGRQYTYMVGKISTEYLEECDSLSERFMYSSEGYAVSTLQWDGIVSAECYLLDIDQKQMKEISSSKTTIELTYAYNAKKDSQHEFTVYALMPGYQIAYSTESTSVETVMGDTRVVKISSVASKTLRIDWQEVSDIDGYIVMRRTQSSTWKKIAQIKDAAQTYCYDSSVSGKKTYYYTVKPYMNSEEQKIFGQWDEEGKRIVFKAGKSNKIPKGDYKAGSVYGPALNAKQLSQVRKAVGKFCNSYITSDMTVIEKVMTAQLFMARYCTYAATWAKNGANTAWGSLVYKNKYGIHEAQCSGFARGFKALCDGMGIPCRYVHANSKSVNSSHQWNEVKVKGKWYIVDPQCNATSGYLAYFLCSGKTYTKESGMKWNKSQYPKVAASDYSEKKLEEVYFGYKIQRILKRLKKK